MFLFCRFCYLFFVVTVFYFDVSFYFLFVSRYDSYFLIDGKLEGFLYDLYCFVSRFVKK